jgi:uridine kinase
MSLPFIIGITGGSGSGKSTFTQLLSKKFGENAAVLTLDNYYHPIQQQPRDLRGKPNFDLPESLNLESFHQDVWKLSHGGTVVQQEYTFNTPTLVPKEIQISPAPLLLIEGLFIFYLPKTEKLFDLKLFLDTKEEIKLQRRLIRDVQERGYQESDVYYTHEHHVSPSFEKYIQHYRDIADVVIPNHLDFKKGLDMVAAYLEHKLANP